MTTEEIARLRALLAQATPGEWEHDIRRLPSCVQQQSVPIVTCHVLPYSAADAALIAATHNALPALLEAAEEAIALRERVAALEKQLWNEKKSAATNALNAAEALLRADALETACQRKDAILSDVADVDSWRRDTAGNDVCDVCNLCMPSAGCCDNKECPTVRAREEVGKR